VYDDPLTVADRRTAVWLLLLDGQWHDTMQINAVNVGGSEGCRRLRELRKEVREGKRAGFTNIVKRKVPDSTQWEYKLLRSRETDPTEFARTLDLFNNSENW